MLHSCCSTHQTEECSGSLQTPWLFTAVLVLVAPRT
jgi:hypothetical protein